MLSPLRILSLDMSSKTGWACIVSTAEGTELIDCGTIPAMSEPDDVPYPANYVNWAYALFANVAKLVDRFAPDILVIEETVGGSKSVYSQKILEYLHFLVARMIRDTGIKARYFLTGEWRSIVGAKMTTEEKKRNKAVREHNEAERMLNGKITSRARGKDGKAIGLISKKHVNIRRANEIFGEFLSRPLVKKDEDTADALLLAYAYHVVRTGI